MDRIDWHGLRMLAEIEEDLNRALGWFHCTEGSPAKNPLVYRNLVGIGQLLAEAAQYVVNWQDNEPPPEVG